VATYKAKRRGGGPDFTSIVSIVFTLFLEAVNAEKVPEKQAIRFLFRDLGVII
jgi:hypothetical protein